MKENMKTEYIDLGLPSGLKWATCNMGASSPEEYGDYFTWHEAIAADWRDGWRMPTQLACQELIDKCIWELTIQNGVNGYKVIGLNGNYIFLPAAGYRIGSSIHREGKLGYYWSSTPYIRNGCAQSIYFNNNNYCILNEDCYDRINIRPVFKELSLF